MTVEITPTPSRPTALRRVLGGTGVLAGAYGAWLLLGTGWDNIVATATWLVGGVVLHDAVLAPLTIALTWLALRVLPTAVRARVAAAAVVVGTLTLVAVPVLGRPGAKPDNPTLLPRDYVQGWLLVVGLVVVVTAVLLVVDRVRESRRP